MVFFIGFSFFYGNLVDNLISSSRMWFSALCWPESFPIFLHGSFHREFEDVAMASLCTNERKRKTEWDSTAEMEGFLRAGYQEHSLSVSLCSTC